MSKLKADAELLLVKQKIFYQLCIYHRRSREGAAFNIRADDLRRDLSIPDYAFADALKSFIRSEKTTGSGGIRTTWRKIS